MTKLMLFLSGSIFSAFAQILVKSGVSDTSSNFFNSMFSWPVVLATFLYFISFISYAAFLKTSDLTIASPLFVGGVVLLIFVYGLIGGESITLLRMLGAALIIGGIFLIHTSAG